MTEELVRFLRRMGWPAHEVDYGVVAVEPHGEADEPEQLDAHLRIWRRVHPRATVELDAAAQL